LTLKGNSQFLIKVRATPARALFAAAGAPSPLRLPPGQTAEPLFISRHLAGLVDMAAPTDHWVLTRPAAPAVTRTPWDDAHQIARLNGYAHYVEPDLLHERTAAAADLAQRDIWPPHAAVPANWHKGAGFAGFDSVPQKGERIWIAHLDTGYTPHHPSTPVHLHPELGKDFWDTSRTTAEDPYEAGLLDQPGHGTGTLGLLAGAPMDLSLPGFPLPGTALGGAPQAEIAPVRVSPSVVHLYTSSMARGLDYALTLASTPGAGCDVVSISHGGLPTQAWADAVNALYEAGIVIVAASGDSIYLGLVDLATRFTVYPGAFNRVITALGATFDKQPYITDQAGQMQGCWGPDGVMEKAIAGYTPKVAWMEYKGAAPFSMRGSGTSCSTPQIAAACALWLQKHGSKVPKDWRRVEACRVALWRSAAKRHQDMPHLGWGLLDVNAMLDDALAAKAIADVTGPEAPIHQSGEDQAPLWIAAALFAGFPPPDNAEEQMYEAEASQMARTSANPALAALDAKAAAVAGKLSPAETEQARQALLQEPISAALRARLERAAPG
jgi:hypothetical protein